MKKLAMAVVAVLVAGVVVQAAVSVSVNAHIPVTIKGKTSAKGTITEKDFAPVGSSNAVVELIDYNVGSLSNIVVIGTVTNDTTGGVTNPVVTASAVVGRRVVDAKGKVTALLGISNAVGTTNGAALVTGKVDETKGTANLKAVGVWVDETSTFSASIKTAKAAKAPKSKKP